MFSHKKFNRGTNIHIEHILRLITNNCFEEKSYNFISRWTCFEVLMATGQSWVVQKNSSCALWDYQSKFCGCFNIITLERLQSGLTDLGH